MSEVDLARLKVELGRHYAAQRESAPQGTLDDLAAAMVAESGRACTGQARGVGPIAFTAHQARFIPAWTWAAQAFFVALMMALAATAHGSDAVKWAIGALSAASVLVGVPALHASSRHGVAELECSCRHNLASVIVARMIVLACSCSLCVALMAGVVASTLQINAFSVALWACPPYFASCAGALLILRRFQAKTALGICAIWVVGCCTVLLALGNQLPDLYADASLTAWAVAALVAFIWLVREALLFARTAAAGLDAFAPHMAKTCN